MIVICNPNNPTGARLTAADLDGIARIADRHGAWILSDEVYRGAELDGVETASMWGRSRTRDRHQRAVEGLRTARPAHRLDRRSAVADRVAVVVPRLRHDRARRAERSARARRAAAGAPRAAVRAHARHPAPQPAADRSVAHRGRRLPVDQAGSRRDRLRALRSPDQLDDARHPPARGEERAHRARRSLRHGRLPAARLRRAARVQPRRPRSAARAAGVAHPAWHARHRVRPLA